MIFCSLFALNLHAGGSGLNTIVVVNQNSPNSVELGNYFAERRQLPPDNILRINWAGGNVQWNNLEFQTTLLNPLLAMIASSQLSNQIDYVVLSMDIPFTVYNGDTINSTTSPLFYGLKTNSGPAWTAMTNSFASSELAFNRARPASAPGASFLATMITAGSLAQAKRLVDQGVDGDGTFPSQPVVLVRTYDAVRSIRSSYFDNAIFNAQLSLAGNYSITRSNGSIPTNPSGLLGMQTGLANFSVPANSFVPGAMADSLTSFGGVIFGPNGQTSLLEFIHAGAAGSYGTVTEPTATTEKFPDPQNYFYQSRGFNIAECYYQSLNIPYQGLIVAEPLSAPCRQLATASWIATNSGAFLNGTVAFTVNFAAADQGHPVQKIDLFVDGKFHHTVTNIPPRPGNQLYFNLSGPTISYTVPANATITSIATDVSTLLNSSAVSNVTKVAAAAHGDRLELHSLPPTNPRAPGNLRVTDATPPGTPGASTSPAFAFSAVGFSGQLTTFLTPGRNTFLDSTIPGQRSYFLFGSVGIGDWLQITVTKTNGSIVTLTTTNQTAGSSAYTLAGNLANLVNSSPALQGADGLSVDNYSAAGEFNLSARSPGRAAAAIKARITSSSMFVSPSAEMDFTLNISDLQSRNHIYVTAGVTNLTATFTLDTTTLADGYHDLTAVAYEGSSVQTQTRISLPVNIRNSTLTASLNFLDPTNSAPVTGTYHVQVSTSTNSISTIKLFTTGGLFSTISNQSSATFTVNGSALGVGLHLFYAIVETPGGLKYRTDTRTARLIASP